MNGFEWRHARHATNPLEQDNAPVSFELILDACLEEMRQHRATVASCLAKFPEYADELCPLLEMAATLESSTPIRPTLSFRQSTRRRVLNLPDPEDSRVVNPMRALAHSAVVRLTVLAAAVALVLAAAVNAADASSSVLPGSPLYSLKRQSENLQLYFQIDYAGAALTHAAIAHRRLEEAQILASTGQKQLAEQATVEYGQQVALALQDLRSEQPDVIQPSAAQLSAQLQREQLELTRSKASAPGECKAVLDHALTLSVQATQQLALVSPIK